MKINDLRKILADYKRQGYNVNVRFPGTKFELMKAYHTIIMMKKLNGISRY